MQGLVNLGEQPPQVVEVSRSLPKRHPIAIQSSTMASAKFILDIFAGATMPVTIVLMHLSGDRIQPIDLIDGHDLLDDEVFESVLLLASSGRIGAALAAPYCSKHSRATLKAPGPDIRAHQWPPRQHSSTADGCWGECSHPWSFSRLAVGGGPTLRFGDSGESSNIHDLGWSSHVSLGPSSRTICSSSLRMYVWPWLAEGLDVCVESPRHLCHGKIMSTSSWQSSTDRWCSPSRWNVYESNHGWIPTRIGTGVGHHYFIICHNRFWLSSTRAMAAVVGSSPSVASPREPCRRWWWSSKHSLSYDKVQCGSTGEAQVSLV